MHLSPSYVRYNRRRTSRSPSAERGRYRRQSRSPVRSPSPSKPRNIISDRLKSRLGPKVDDEHPGRLTSSTRSQGSPHSRSPRDSPGKRKAASPSVSSSRSSSPGGHRGLVSYDDVSPIGDTN